MARAMKKKKCSLRYYQTLIMVGIVVLLLFQFKVISLSVKNIDKGFDKPESSIPSAPVVTNCTCVDCNEDKICGGLWRGNRYPGMPSEEEVIHVKIHIVVSHCKWSLDWMPKYLKGFTNIASIHVISKCGQVVKGAPNEAVTVVLPNVGRCDHAYAHYITNILPQLVTTKDATQDNSIVVFLKDTTMVRIHQGSMFRRTSLKSLARIASSVNGFACGLDIVQGSEISAYHVVKKLREQQLKGYNKGEQDYKTGDGVPFRSKYKTLGDFYEALNFSPPPYSLVQQCYGGIFAVRTMNIFQQDMNLWRILRKTLERGDNIQEGHFAERSWGPLLAKPLQGFQTKALLRHSTRVRDDHFSIHGALIREAAKNANETRSKQKSRQKIQDRTAPKTRRIHIQRVQPMPKQLRRSSMRRKGQFWLADAMM